MINPMPENAGGEDVTIINLSIFKQEKRHLALLSRGLSFSPSADMDEFEIYKDLNLFLRRVYYRSLYSDRPSEPNVTREPSTGDTLALKQLESLFEEGGISSDDDETSASCSWRRDAGLRIWSTKMPQLRKDKRLGIFLDLVQEDLAKINWHINDTSNLPSDERQALMELRKSDKIIIKPRDKGGNVVLLPIDMYEAEVHRLLSDQSTYKKLEQITHLDPLWHLSMTVCPGLLKLHS